jgi:hypothetical protein
MTIARFPSLILAAATLWSLPTQAFGLQNATEPAAVVPGTEAAETPQEPADHPLRAESIAVRKRLAEFLANKDLKLKVYTSKNGRLRVYTDNRGTSEIKKVLKASEQILATFDWAFGPYVAPEKGLWRRDDFPMEVLVVKKEEIYFGLIDALSETSPRLAPYLQSTKKVTGFNLYPAKITVTYNDVKVQAEARVDHSVAHSLAHLEMHRRFSFTPLWLAEGVACAMEELTFGEIWTNWYRDSFVFATSHGGWRGNATQRVVKKIDLEQLWSYPANPYQDDLAHLSYGWAIYMLEAQPQKFQQLCKEIQKRYDEFPELGGQFKLKPETAAQISLEVFGDTLQQDLRAYWKKTPKRPKVNKARKFD